MKKKIEDYLHFYLGCECLYSTTAEKDFKGILNAAMLNGVSHNLCFDVKPFYAH